ncbi:MAG: hypothetical protein F4W95_13780 [Chloroflexi bacterium]|nr:hypothetical protein [Chloroflexota bacterium]MYD49533.1 hypothetical protein [Chloroflexota bacterium]
MLDDADSLLGRLHVAKARFDHVEPFSLDLFKGFSSLRALTYSVSIPMITRLMREVGFDELEVVFGHAGLINRTVEDVLSFQHVVEDLQNQALVTSLDDEKRQELFDSVAAGKTRFYVVKDAAISHAKIYLLENSHTNRRRVVVGSANLSEQALSGKQAETLLAFDDDDAAWAHYCAQYEAVRDTATSKLELRPQPLPALDLAEIPALKEALEDERETGVTIFTPPVTSAEELTFQVVEHKVERIRDYVRKDIGDQRPDRSGNVVLNRHVIGQIVRLSRSRTRENEAEQNTWLTINPDRQSINLSGKQINLEADWPQVRGDTACWLEFFDNYGKGFSGDVPRLQRDYFTFMSWFYFSPLLCELRDAALRQNMSSFNHPMFAVMHGDSSCGKTTFIETLMTSMFEFWQRLEPSQFTASNLRALRHSYRRFPVFFDDITRDRFNRYGEEIIKDPNTPGVEYPCFVISMNANARNFKTEVIKRCLMIYTRTYIPGDRIVERNQLQRSVTGIRSRLTTSLYREYLRRILAVIDGMERSDAGDADVLELSSGVLRNLINEAKPDGAVLPQWCQQTSLIEYQERAFERPKLLLENLISKDRYSKRRNPPESYWSLRDNQVVVNAGTQELRSLRTDIPDWILDDTSSVAGLLTLKRKELEDFLGVRSLKPRNPLQRFLSAGR